MLMLAYTARTVLNGIIMVHSTSQHVSIIAKGNYVKLATIVVIGMSSSTIAAKFSFTNIFHIVQGRQIVTVFTGCQWYESSKSEKSCLLRVYNS